MVDLGRARSRREGPFDIAFTSTAGCATAALPSAAQCCATESHMIGFTFAMSRAHRATDASLKGAALGVNGSELSRIRDGSALDVDLIVCEQSLHCRFDAE